MGASRKYTFDVEFRPEGDLISNQARARMRKGYSQDEIDALCARAREAGIKAGQVRATEAVAQGLNEAVSAIREALASTHDIVEAVRAEAAELALTATRKLAGAVLAACPVPEVESVLREAMHQAIGEPRLVLHVAPKVAEELSPRLSDIAHEAGFDGRVVIHAQPGLKQSDCRIEWRGGGAERIEEALAQSLGALIARHFSNSPQRALTEA